MTVAVIKIRAPWIGRITGIFMKVVRPVRVGKKPVKFIAAMVQLATVFYEKPKYTHNQQSKENSEYQDYAGVMVHKWPLQVSGVLLSEEWRTFRGFSCFALIILFHRRVLVSIAFPRLLRKTVQTFTAEVLFGAMALFLVTILRLLVVAVAEIKQSTAKAAPVSLELRQASIKFSVTPASHGGKIYFQDKRRPVLETARAFSVLH